MSGLPQLEIAMGIFERARSAAPFSRLDSVSPLHSTSEPALPDGDLAAVSIFGLAARERRTTTEQNSPLSELAFSLFDEQGSKEWHSVGQDVYHNNRTCTEGNNIEPWNARPGSGGKRLCNRCSELGALARLLLDQ